MKDIKTIIQKVNRESSLNYIAKSNLEYGYLYLDSNNHLCSDNEYSYYPYSVDYLYHWKKLMNKKYRNYSITNTISDIFFELHSLYKDRKDFLLNIKNYNNSLYDESDVLEQIILYYIMYYKLYENTSYHFNDDNIMIYKYNNDKELNYLLRTKILQEIESDYKGIIFEFSDTIKENIKNFIPLFLSNKNKEHYDLSSRINNLNNIMFDDIFNYNESNKKLWFNCITETKIDEKELLDNNKIDVIYYYNSACKYITIIDFLKESLLNYKNLIDKKYQNYNLQYNISDVFYILMNYNFIDNYHYINTAINIVKSKIDYLSLNDIEEQCYIYYLYKYYYFGRQFDLIRFDYFRFLKKYNISIDGSCLID